MVLGPLGKISNIFFSFAYVFSCAAGKISEVTGLQSLVNKEEANYYKVYPSSTFECGQYPLAKYFYPVQDASFANPLTMYDGGVHFNPSGILHLSHGKVTSDEGIVISSKDKLLDFTVEFFYAGGRAKYRAASHSIMKKEFAPPQKYSETIAVLACRNYQNYYGWLFGILPRYHLLTQLNLYYDRLYLPPINRTFQKETLELLGMPFKQHSIIANNNTHIQADSLLVPTISENRKQYPDWVINYLRETFLPYTKPLGKRKKIYIARKNRGLKNEEELFLYLQPLGFQKVYLEKLPFLEQVQLFSEAEYIIGVHGAGFANVVFCSQDAVIIEIFNQGWLSPTFWGISQHLGQKHHCILSDMSKLSNDEKAKCEAYVSVKKILDIINARDSDY